jgi:hypothetical protein
MSDTLEANPRSAVEHVAIDPKRALRIYDADPGIWLNAQTIWCTARMFQRSSSNSLDIYYQGDRRRLSRNSPLFRGLPVLGRTREHQGARPRQLACSGRDVCVATGREHLDGPPGGDNVAQLRLARVDFRVRRRPCREPPGHSANHSGAAGAAPTMTPRISRSLHWGA